MSYKNRKAEYERLVAEGDPEKLKLTGLSEEFGAPSEKKEEPVAEVPEEKTKKKAEKPKEKNK